MEWNTCTVISAILLPAVIAQWGVIKTLYTALKEKEAEHVADLRKAIAIEVERGRSDERVTR